MEKMVLEKPCYIPQGGFLSSRNILRYAGRSVPGGSRSCQEQVNQGSYRGEIKDGGNQTSTCERQSLAGTEKQAGGSWDRRGDESVRRARTSHRWRSQTGQWEITSVNPPYLCELRQVT